MSKYLVIGNPIEHSLSPELHNYWMKQSNINSTYEKKLIQKEDIKDLIKDLKNNSLSGINVTVPFKKSVIPFMDGLTPEADETKSVNTIFKDNEKIIGHNTDIGGFELGLRHIKYNVRGKKVFILGAGGVSPSIIYALIKMNVSEIFLSNRTSQKAVELKKNFEIIKIVEWGKLIDFDMIINATSIGLNNKDQFPIDLENLGPNKFFYDVIYNPAETNFLSIGKKNGNFTENGKIMFIYQAHQAFTIWHKIMPKVDDETIKLLD
tara:strand:- start:824 stop:1615 length:792 start_codon:yes stop_codon:yes gene_type:complete